MEKITVILNKTSKQITLQLGLNSSPLMLSELASVTKLAENLMLCQETTTGRTLLLLGMVRLIPANSLLNLAQLEQLLSLPLSNYLNRLSGRFALIEIDIHQGTILCATDRFASMPLYYADNDQQLTVSNDLMALSSHLPNVNMHPQALLDYVYYHMIPSPKTIYREVNKLPLASVLRYQQSLTVETYWQPDFTPTRKSKQALARELQQSLLDAVAPYTELQNVGSFLSGGLDSSTVTACLAKLTGQRVKTFTIGFSEQGYDETAYAKVIADAFDTEHHVYYVTPEDIVAELPKLAAHFFEPFGNSSALPTYFCARFARQKGVTNLLAGDGGDELFSGNERYAKQLIFERFNRLPLWLRSITAALVNKGSSIVNVSLLRKGQSFLSQSKLDLASRLQHYNFLHQHSLQEVFIDEFLQQVDAMQPLSMIQQRFSDVLDCGPVNSMLYNDWKFTLADNDLVKVNTMTDFAGINVAYPLLDQALLELANRISPKQKLEKGQLRAFYKYACKSLLPEATLKKNKHGFGLPFGRWLSTHTPLQQLAYNQLEALKKRGIFKENFIDKVIEQHRSYHAVYYGELIWVLTMLELWLNAHQTEWKLSYQG